MDREDELRMDWYRLTAEIRNDMVSDLEDAWMDGLPDVFTERIKEFRKKTQQLANVGILLTDVVRERIENG